MSDLLIKNLDDEVVKELNLNALKYGKSIEEYAKDLLLEKVTNPKKMSREEFIKFAEKMREQNGLQKTDSTLLIREDWDERNQRDAQRAAELGKLRSDLTHLTVSKAG